jgi:hypothetical protein
MLGLSNACSSSSYIPFSSTKSLSLDGSNDYLDCGSIDFNTDNFSVSCWVNTSDWTIYSSIWSNRNSSGTAVGFQLRANGTANQLDLISDFGTGSGTFITSTITGVPADTWCHVVCTVDRDGDQVIYLNGDAVIDTDSISSNSAVDCTNTSEPFTIGRNHGSIYHDMLVDEVAIWNSVLPAAAVTALYDNGNPTELTSAKGDYTAQANLVAWWRMGDGAFDNISVVHDQVNPGLGAELVVNGDFAIASGAGVGWTAATSTNIGETTGGYGYISKVDTETLSQAGILEVDKSYYYTFIAKSGNEVGLGHLHISGASATWRQIEDVPADWTTYSGCIRADNVNFTFSESSHGNIYIDNVSVKEVNGNPALIIGGVSSFSNSFSNSFN